MHDIQLCLDETGYDRWDFYWDHFCDLEYNFVATTFQSKLVFAHGGFKRKMFAREA